ncbi:MAG: hypothetical protein RBT49_11170 [Bacteroidales bacterium]|jgi:hypothetical protein|nr:hypothetical protein [Bacteroidales bacterium]
MRWTRENIPVEPKRIWRLAPIFEKAHGKVTWHSFTRGLINEFGNIEGFMGDLDSNFSSFTWTGSLVPLIEMKIGLVNELLQHKLESVRE